MPSERFLHLPEEKQNTILKASMAEFIKEPYEKVSINKIIQNAGISRGSFYTYFEDKRDLLSFVLEETKSRWLKSCMSNLEKSGGDIFAMMGEVLEVGFQFIKSNDMFRLHRNVILYQESSNLGFSPEIRGMEQAIREELFKKMDCSRLRDGTVEGVARLVKVSMGVIVMGVAELYQNPEKEQEIRQECHRIMDVLKYGAYKSLEGQMEE